MKTGLLIPALFLIASGTTGALDAHATGERTILMSVLDKRGHPVQHAQVDSIQVAENGQPVKISRLSPATNSPILFTILIDTSKWAHQEKTRDALDGVLDFLSRVLRENDRFIIGSFSDRFRYGEPMRDLALAKKEINNLNWGVRSTFYDALVQLPAILSRFRVESERQIVIVLTDGNDSASRASLKDAIASVQANDIVVFAIDIRFVMRIRAGFEEELRLAEESGGRCFQFVSNKELESAFTNIQAAIEGQYFLTYAPTPEPHAKLRVKADNLRISAPRHREE
jgi:Ca-activated chloride channel homolog